MSKACWLGLMSSLPFREEGATGKEQNGSVPMCVWAHALTMGGNKDSGMNCAGELQRHQCLWLPAELLAEGTVGWFISELTSPMQSADHHQLL